MGSSFRAGRRRVLSTAFRLLTAFAVAAGIVTVSPPPAQAATTQFRGVNWADARDNFVDGVLYVSGLGSADTYSSAAVVGNQVVGQLYSITGANTVRMPVNEPTVSTYWGTYTGAIDAALSRGKVILAYWAHSSGKPASTAAFDLMWDTIVARYGGNPDAYFEVINEPYGYSTTNLNNLYNAWLNRHSSVPRGRVILDGAGYAQNVAAVGNDSRLDGTLLAVHDYSFFVNPPYEDENSWADHIGNYIGSHAARTVATEWGGPMGPGSKNGVSYDSIDYNVPSGSFFADYVRGVSSRLRGLGVGGVYWPGLRDGDWYSMTSKSGSGSAIRLSLVNASGLDRLQYSWGLGDAGDTYVQFRNAGTGQVLDGMGRTSSGSSTGQGGDNDGTTQQWVVENTGGYVRIKNRSSGLYLDGMGRTSDGATVAQYTGTGSANQQWQVLTDANNVRIRNRATGLYLDGMGRTGAGADLGQYSSSASANQRWKIVAVS